MKRLFISLLAVTATLFVSAQDVIFLGANDSIVAKVISVGINEITYQKWTNLEGPVYSMPIDQIAAIRYSNGTYDFFNIKPAPVAQTTSSTTSVIRSGNTYMYGDLVMGKSAFENWLQENNCPVAYQQFSSGLNLSKAGWLMMSLGLALDLGSVIITAALKNTPGPSSAAIALFHLQEVVSEVVTLMMLYQR